MNYLMSVYGISVKHPQDWCIYINPNKSFTANHGFLKIENLKPDLQEQISFSITWEETEALEEGFAHRYMQQIEQQYKRNLRKEKRYNVIEKEIVEICGHEACFVHSTMKGNTHVFRALGKNVTLEILQLAVYCPQTERIIVGTLTGANEYISQHFDEWKALLFTLRCHEVGNMN